MSEAKLYEWADGVARELHPSQPVDEALLGLPSGVYEALRSRGVGRFFRLEHHIKRAQQGCAAAGIPIPDEGRLRRGLDAASRAFGTDAKIRIDFQREPVAELGARTSTLFSCRPLTLPSPSTYANGVGVRLAPQLQREQPEVKGTKFLTARAAHVSAEDDYESILVGPDGSLLECLMSNLFFIQGTTLRTAATGVLEGITRSTVLECAEELDLEVELRAIHTRELPGMSEAFLTTSVRGLVPIVRIEGNALGDGRPGPRTLALAAAYAAKVERESRPAWPRDSASLNQ